MTRSNRYGASVELSGKASGNEPVTIRLAPCGSAHVRLVDPAGKPIANYRVAIQIVVTPGGFSATSTETFAAKILPQTLVRAIGYANYYGGTPTDAAGLTTFSRADPGRDLSPVDDRG